MEFAREINNRRADLAEVQNNLDAAIAANNGEEAERLTNQARLLNAEIANLEMRYQQSRANVDENGHEIDEAYRESHPFNSVGEQAMAIRNAAQTGTVDNRLIAVNEAAGMNTGTPGEGGYAVQQDFLVQMVESAVSAGEISGRCTRASVGENSNSVKLVSIKETDNSETILGGVRAYYIDEAEQIQASKPTLDYITIDLNTQAAMLYATHNMLRDAKALTSEIINNVPLALTYLLEDKIISGGTAGSPASIMSSNALNTVTPTATKAEVINMADLLAMQTAMLPKSRNNAVWVMHPDMEQYLPQLAMVIGTGGVPIYLPPTGISGNSYSTLLGKPIVFSEHMGAVGTKGDIGFMDFSQYEIITKGNLQQDISIHAMFDTAQTAFRFMMDNGGAPLVNHTTKLKNSKILRSPFVVLGARPTGG